MFAKVKFSTWSQKLTQTSKSNIAAACLKHGGSCHISPVCFSRLVVYISLESHAWYLTASAS